MPPINFITPWPSQRNGIADYSYELSKHIHHPHHVVTECLNPTSSSKMATISHPNDRISSKLLARGDNIFHFGNNPDHIFAVPLYLKYGGYVVVHDLSLHYLAELADTLLPGFFPYFLDKEQPNISQDLIKLWKTSGKKTSVDYKEINMLSWLTSAKGIIVHSHYAAGIIKGYNSLANIHIIPHFAYQLIPNEDVAQKRASSFRKKLGLDDDIFIVSTSGFITSNKQYLSILRAIGSLPEASREKLRFIIAGEKRLNEYDIDQVVRDSGVAEAVVMTGFLDEAELTDLLAASNLVMNLRYPTFGESSGSIARALGCGSVAVVTDSGAYSELPDDVCFKVRAQPDSYFDISKIIELCMSDPDHMKNRKRSILKYAKHDVHPEIITQRYMNVIAALGNGR